jgi:ABC-type transport system substrate-binding protein
MASAAGAGAIALSLAGCGGGDDEGDTGGDATGLVSEPVDTTSRATPGGRLQMYITADVTSFDGIAGNTGVSFTHAVHGHSRLMKYIPGKYPNAPDGSVEADAATSWEFSQEGLQATFKVRPNLKYDPRPPTNNRAMNAQDIMFTWERFSTLNQGRTDLTGRPEAPIESVFAPDNMTVVMRLRFPYVPLFTMLPFYRYMSIQPVELEQYNYKGEQRGTGAWRLRDVKPGATITYDKNPDWYDAKSVMLEGLDYYVVPEYAAYLAQFRAGNLWSVPVRQEDLLQTKRDLPQLVMQSSGQFSRGLAPYTAFSVLPDSPFLDERVRQAMSMLVDRDLWIETFYNVSAFESEGLDVPKAWNSHLPAGDTKWYIDPQSSEMGAAAKFFKYDPAEAKKLLRAAGHNGPIEAKHNWTHNAYGGEYSRHVQVLNAMFQQEGDFKLPLVQHDYATDWTPNFHQGHGTYEGIATGTLSNLPDVDGLLYAVYRSGGQKTWWGLVDPQNDALIDAQRRETDINKRVSLVKDWQRYYASKMYNIASPAQAQSFSLAWPWYGNRGVFNSYESGNAATEEYTKMWYDASKKTS